MIKSKALRTYNVNSIPLHQLTITGKADSPFWEKANILSYFHSPWEAIKDTETKFKALCDGDSLYFCFEVLDDTIHIDETDDSFHSINVSDRVELFFRSNASLNPYYCLEIDPTSRIMDFKAYPNKNFDFNWNWPHEGLLVNSSFNPQGFCVEGKISIASLKELNLIHDGKIETGIYRAKYYKTKKNDFEPIWLTWINPKTETPNFHISSSFGVLKLN
ncbi:MAG: endoxylanase [Flavobacteriaceae bacterium CG_4_9_14_3_um_filter_33_16]|nr:MAG: endoxylanase [Flavobacteriaceae bacterium CG_4_9_14_3_um_filter_33_16]